MGLDVTVVGAVTRLCHVGLDVTVHTVILDLRWLKQEDHESKAAMSRLHSKTLSQKTFLWAREVIQRVK